MILWKTIPEGFESHGHKWRMNKWYEVEGELIMCENGFHASRLLPDAFFYVSPYWVCKVEIGDDFIEDGDKVVARRMRIIKKYRWTKRDNVRFAVWCARRSLQFFENEFPDNKRPRRAIEAAEKYLSNPCKRTENAALSAARSAAWSARSAAWSARSAAWSAWSAAWSAASSARSAAWSARSAALSAESAAGAAGSARSAAGSAEKKIQHHKILRMLKESYKKCRVCGRTFNPAVPQQVVCGRQECLTSDLKDKEDRP